MGGGLPRIPDYRIYKVENVPNLMRIQDRLAKQGLRDPWLRNEVWRFHPGFGTMASRMKLFFSRGFVPGIILGYLTYLANMEFNKRNPNWNHWHDPDFPEQGQAHPSHGHHQEQADHHNTDHNDHH